MTCDGWLYIDGVIEWRKAFTIDIDSANFPSLIACDMDNGFYYMPNFSRGVIQHEFHVATVDALSLNESIKARYENFSAIGKRDWMSYNACQVAIVDRRYAYFNNISFGFSDSIVSYMCTEFNCIALWGCIVDLNMHRQIKDFLERRMTWKMQKPTT